MKKQKTTMWLCCLFLTCPMDPSLARLCSVLFPRGWPPQMISQGSRSPGFQLGSANGKWEDRRRSSSWSRIYPPPPCHVTILTGSITSKALALSRTPVTKFLPFLLQGWGDNDFLLLLVPGVSSYLFGIPNHTNVQFITSLFLKL